MVDPVLRLGAGGGLNESTIVVTGGAGFIGSHVVARLLAEGASVKVIDDLSTGRLDNLHNSLGAGLTDGDIRICDVRSAEAADAIRLWLPEIVVHLAAQSNLPASTRSPLVDADINIRGTVNVLDACAAAGTGLVVYAATSAIYGTVDGGALPVGETAPMAPTSPYGLSKATALKYLDWYRDHRSVDYTALVLGNVYGPRQVGPSCGVVGLMAQAAVAGADLAIFGDGHQTRDFVFVADVAEAVTAACTTGGLGLINIASGVETTVGEIAGWVAQAAGTGTPRHADPLPGEVRRMALDISRARDLLGWHPTTPLAEGVRITVRAARRRDSIKEAS
ncbi:NAD-dependent epimerase/dehydratase family protein [Micromonospora sp. NPDC049102]|uniref:NAD-dependent epimerase/dehydratase family protein n=1 Tax=Micromonospora sp. NPDC049102 TaxID=3364265 RepID=UPI0037219DE0